MMKLTKIFISAAAVMACTSVYANNWYNSSIVNSGTYTSPFSSSDITQSAGSCAHIIVNVTSISGSIVPHIEGKDQLTGNYYDILVGDAITDVGATVLKVCPGITAVKGQSTADMIPYQWRIELIFKGTASATLSVEDNYQ